jgi:hypothetical protein
MKAEIELPPKLVNLFDGEARYRVAFGGRGSGKTRSFALMSAVYGYRWGMSGKQGQILCARSTSTRLTSHLSKRSSRPYNLLIGLMLITRSERST